MKRVLAIVLATMVLGVAACGAASAADEIVIGCFQDITGPTSSSGKMVEAGIQWAIDEINAAGGVNGSMLKMNVYDTAGNVTEAINAYTRAVATDKVNVVIGPPVANIVLAINTLSEEYDTPLIGFAIDPDCQIKEDGTPYKNIFLAQPSSVQMGTIMAKDALNRGYMNVGILYNESNAYATKLRNSFVETFEPGGGTVLDSVPFTAGNTDFKTLLSKLIAGNPDAIYTPNYTQELVLIVQQARDLGYDGPLICGVDCSPPWNRIFNDDASGVYFINNYFETDVAEMAAEIQAKLDIEPTNKFYLGYDITHHVAKVIAEVGSDPVAIRDGLENITNFEGLTGTLTIDPSTHMPVGLNMYVYTYDDSIPGNPVLIDSLAAEEAAE